MRPSGLRGALLSGITTAGLLAASLACSSAIFPAGGQSADVAVLQQQVALQNTRIAVLETRVAGPAQPGAQARPALPTPTIIPPVAGLTVDGAVKGLPTAKVTITEYIDYL